MSAIEPFLVPGTREIDIAIVIKRLALAHGCRHMAFETLVASGVRSAYPHGKPTQKKLRDGDLVFIDFGVKVNGYCSDITRTFVVGKPTTKQKKIMAIVKEAQRRAIAKVKAGALIADVDLAARDYIQRFRLEKYFVHSTGHGVGKRVHVKPRVHFKTEGKLKAGEIITIEPGIYIKGWGGVRIEDMVRVEANGCKILGE